MFGLCYIHVNKYKGEKMQPIAKYTWSHICSKYFGMYFPKAVYAKLYDLRIYNRSAYAYNKAASWSNPPVAPPIDPLKYGTPQRYNFMGDVGWNPI